MHPNFGVPVVPGVSNNPFFQPNPNNFNPNGCSSMPMFQMNTTSQFLSPNQPNTQHVFQSNSGFPGQAPSPFMPDFQMIKSVPPPPLPGNHVPEIPAPTWNSTQMINNNQAGQFQGRPPSAPHFPPPMFPSNNYNNINAAYSSSNGFTGQQNSIHQTANAFQRNQTAFNPFPNVNFNSSVQSTSNSFGFASNGDGRNQSKRKAAFSNDRNSSNFNQDSRAAKRFKGCNSMQSDSKQIYRPPGFRDSSNVSQSGYEQFAPESPFMVESNGETSHNGNKFYHNRGQKRRHPSNSYSNNKDINLHSTHQGNGHNYMNAKNGFKKMCLKSERNSDLPKLHSCDTCDRAFASEADLQYHLSEHIKCDSGDCQFEAHPKIVALHKKMQHDTGYADAISKLKNADEIEKWRAERRRRFPTLENIEKRKAEQAEKEARGEVIENKEFGKYGGRNSQPSGSRNNDGTTARKRRRGPHKMRYAYNAAQYPHSVAKRTVNVSDSESDTDDDSHIKLPKFLGMAALDSPENENLESHSLGISSNSHELSGMAVLDSPENENLESHSHGISSDSHELSVPVRNTDVESVDPMENPVEKNTFTELNLERDEQQKDGVIVAVDTDSADDSPIELHVEENTLENQSIGKGDDLPQRKVSNSVVDVDIDDEPPTEIPITKMKDNLPQSQAISTVIDADIDDEAPIEIPIAKSVSSINGNIEKDSAEDSPVELHAEQNTSGNQSTRKEGKNGRHNSKANFNGNKEYPELPRKSGLLEKLLSDDIRHERNVIMQCIRHIVKKNFFDVNVNN